jgi:hypothetical protein
VGLSSAGFSLWGFVLAGTIQLKCLNTESGSTTKLAHAEAYATQTFNPPSVAASKFSKKIPMFIIPINLEMTKMGIFQLSTPIKP